MQGNPIIHPWMKWAAGEALVGTLYPRSGFANVDVRKPTGTLQSSPCSGPGARASATADRRTPDADALYTRGERIRRTRIACCCVAHSRRYNSQLSE